MDDLSKEQFKDDKMCKEFLNDEEALDKIANSKEVSDLDSSKYVAIYLPGGHGPMFDLPDNTEIQKFIANVYDKGGYISAVCHGVCALLHVQLKNGEKLLEGKRVTAFSNDEEISVGK